MDSRSSTLRQGAILVLITGLSTIVSANPVVIYHGNFNFLIPFDQSASQGAMADAIITIPYHYAVSDLDVILNITHSRVFDLEIKLRSPSGKKIFLNKYDYKTDYFEGADYTQTIFDDEAETAIEDGCVPFAGKFRPKAGNLLAVFDGEDCYGQWVLKIRDQFYYDTGILHSFDVVITVPQPATAILLLLGAGLTTAFKPR